MGIAAKIERGPASAFLHDDGHLTVNMSSPTTADADTFNAHGWITFSNGCGSDASCTLYLPSSVAQAMKTAFDKAMGELNSKEDAA